MNANATERSTTIIIKTKKTNTIMAEVMENTCHHDKYATKAKANAGLTTGKL